MALEYRALLQQVETLVALSGSSGDVELQALWRQTLDAVTTLEQDAAAAEHNGTQEGPCASPTACRACHGDASLESICTCTQAHAHLRTDDHGHSAELPLPPMEVTAWPMRRSTSTPAAQLQRIPEAAPSTASPVQIPRLQSLTEQLSRIQVRAVARRLAPPSSLPQGTAIQALDTGSRQWLDATVQGTSPAGTCLRVSFVDAGPCVLVPPSSIRPRSGPEAWDSAVSGGQPEADLEKALPSVARSPPTWLSGQEEGDDARTSQRQRDTTSIDSKGPDGNVRSSTSHRSPGFASERVAWVDPATFWENVRRNGEELNRRDALEAPSDTNAQVVKRSLRRTLQLAHTKLVVTGRVIMHDPMAFVVPILVLCALLGLGLWGVYSVSNSAADSRREKAMTVAISTAQRLLTHINVTMTPASTVAMLIMLTPDFPQVNQTFFKVAPELVSPTMRSNGVITIVICPNGIVQSIIPEGLPGWDTVYGLDLLQNLTWRKDALRTIELHNDGMVMTGPVPLRAGPMGLVTRYAVFIDGAGPNETFGAPGQPYNCSVCYEPPVPAGPDPIAQPATGPAKFWGFSQLNVDWEVLTRNATRIYDMCDVFGLAMQMTYVDPTGANHTIASCGGPIGPGALFMDLDIMHNHWVMAFSDQAGWNPDWLSAVVAVVVVVSLMVATLLMIVLVNRREHMWLLQAMLPEKVISTLQRGEAYCEAFDNVTVLFSDVVSYTTIASKLAPINIVTILNEMYSAYDALVDDYECYKVETIGDALMAVCGTQGESPTMAACKVASLALAMIERTRSLMAPLAEGGADQKLQIRIGAHSGPVVGAVLGRKMPHFCLCGDTVNVASRMESYSSPMAIHISASTAELLELGGSRRWLPFQGAPGPEGSLIIESRGPIEVKGKGLMNTYWLSAKDTIDVSFKGVGKDGLRHRRPVSNPGAKEGPGSPASTSPADRRSGSSPMPTVMARLSEQAQQQQQHPPPSPPVLPPSSLLPLPSPPSLGAPQGFVVHQNGFQGFGTVYPRIQSAPRESSLAPAASMQLQNTSGMNISDPTNEVGMPAVASLSVAGGGGNVGGGSAANGVGTARPSGSGTASFDVLRPSRNRLSLGTPPGMLSTAGSFGSGGSVAAGAAAAASAPLAAQSMAARGSGSGGSGGGNGSGGNGGGVWDYLPSSLTQLLNSSGRLQRPKRMSVDLRIFQARSGLSASDRPATAPSSRGMAP